MAYRRDQRSSQAQAYRLWYGLVRWKQRRSAQLAAQPLCERCLAKGIINDGSLTMDGQRQSNPKRRHLVANHIRPHKGDPDLFWNGPLETACPDHHDIVIQQEERGRVVEEIDPSTGLPFGA